MKLPGIGSILAIRVLSIFALVFFGAQLIVLWVFWNEHRSGTEPAFLLPLPARVAAMVELVDEADPQTREMLVRALSSSDSRVFIADGEVRGERRDGAAAAAFRSALQLYNRELSGRDVTAMVGVEGRAISAPETTSTGLQADYPMRLVIGLSDGRSMVVETPSLIEWRFRRTPVGLFAGLFGIVVATLALWNVWNVVRPARDMALAARRFSDSGIPQPVRPGGGADMRGLVLAFNDLQERVARLMAGRTLVMSAMSHDVRTYLTRLRLRIEPLETASREAAERAIDEIQALLDDTLALAEADNTLASDKEQVELGAWLRTFAGSGQFDVGLLEITATGQVFVDVNPGRLERALVNIVSNAIKYAGKAEIGVSQSPGEAVIKVADRGPGIPDADKRRVFEPFYRRDTSRNRAKEGAGLGLAIAETLILRQGGQISLLDRPGGGLIVRVSLPLASSGPLR
jgi:signal transduction histidine kinase